MPNSDRGGEPLNTKGSPAHTSKSSLFVHPAAFLSSLPCAFERSRCSRRARSWRCAAGVLSVSYSQSCEETVHVQARQRRSGGASAARRADRPEGWPAAGTLSTGLSRETSVEVCLLHVGMLCLGVHNVPGHTKGGLVSAGAAGSRVQAWACIGPSLGLHWACIGPALGLHWACAPVPVG